MTALLLMLTLSAMALMSLQSAIYDIGTSRFYRVDALTSEYTMGGANASLSLAIKNPTGFDNFMEKHNYQILNTDISKNYFTEISNDTRSVFAPDTYTTSFKTISTAPENIGSIPGFNIGKYCIKKYNLTITGTLTHNQGKDKYMKTLRGVVLIGPLVCQ